MYGAGAVAPPGGPAHSAAEGLSPETAVQTAASVQTDTDPDTRKHQSAAG